MRTDSGGLDYMQYDVIGKTPVTQAWLIPYQEIVLAKFGNLLISDIHNYFTAEYAVGLYFNSEALVFLAMQFWARYKIASRGTEGLCERVTTGQYLTATAKHDIPRVKTSESPSKPLKADTKSPKKVVLI